VPSGHAVVSAMHLHDAAIVPVPTVVPVLPVAVMVRRRTGAMPLRLRASTMSVELAVVIGTAVMLVAQMPLAVARMVSAVMRSRQPLARMVRVMLMSAVLPPDVDPAVVRSARRHRRERRWCLGCRLPVGGRCRRHGRCALLWRHGRVRGRALLRGRRRGEHRSGDDCTEKMDDALHTVASPRIAAAERLHSRCGLPARRSASGQPLLGVSVETCPD
jgi:hypothetical protein